MKFEIGKEYKTRRGNKAGIFCDMSAAPDYEYDYPLKGYIERKDGTRGDASWTAEGGFTANKNLSEHPFDLMLPLTETTSYVFMSWKEDLEDLYSNFSLAEAEKGRAYRKDCGWRVSPIIAIKFTEDSAKEQEK